ncbi:MAG: helix-turn-helix transcriptional regulator [Clostridiales bacterium]|nr:helix-turn-helix transcriptional regulator [Clostridiales bacterium]
MFFHLKNKNKTIKELRKRQGYTVKELADKLKIEISLISRIDDRKLKDIPDPLKSKLLPVLRGDDLNKIPW